MKKFTGELLIVLAVVMLVAVIARAETAPSVSVINLGSLPGPMSALYKGKPAVLVMIYNESPVLGNYSVILPWVDKSGARQTTAKECPASGLNTACVFDVDSVSEGTPIIAWTPDPQPRSLKSKETKE
jgi:hypothetical protein